MKRFALFTISLLLISFSFAGSLHHKVVSAKIQSSIKEETVVYSADGVTMIGYVAYDSSSNKKRPAILVVPEWWGLTDYAKSRARQLAALGYIAMAVDMYGDGKVADNPGDAGKLATPFYKDPEMAKTRFDAALAKLKTFKQTDTKMF